VSAATATAPRADRAPLEAAREGDGDAYRRLVEAHRAELWAHCYRMLGSPHDADDALQEALFRAWRGLPRFEGRSSFRSWLYRIATNASLDARRRQTALVPIGDEALAVEDGEPPDARFEQRESLDDALAALELLPEYQRAVVFLREALGLSSREIARALGTTEASVNSALQRARARLEPATRGPNG
jgi:RNA polymerase sigma-70 factor, ECF subfamily